MLVPASAVNGPVGAVVDGKSVGRGVASRVWVAASTLSPHAHAVGALSTERASEAGLWVSEAAKEAEVEVGHSKWPQLPP